MPRSAATLAEGYCLGTPLRFELAERGDPADVVEPLAAALTARFGHGVVEVEMSAMSPLPRDLLEPKDAKCFQPSSFASRKAQADENNAQLAHRRLVSLGPLDYPQKNLRTGEIEYLEVEIFTDLDHPADRWVEFPDRPGLAPRQDYQGGKDEVTRSTLKRPLGRPQVSAHNEPQLDGPQPR